MRLPGRKASAIYPARRLPAGSSATYPPTRTGRPSEARTKIFFLRISASVYMVLQPAVRTAAGIAVGTGGLLPHLFTLAWPVSRKKRAASAVVLCYGCTSLRPSGSFTSAAPCVARTFLPFRFTASGAGSSGRAPLLVIRSCFLFSGHPRSGLARAILRIASSVYLFAFSHDRPVCSTPSRPKVRRRRPGLCPLDIPLSRILI